MWHICSEFSLKCFSGEKRLGYRKNVCYRRYLNGAFGGVGNFVQYHFVCVCVSALRMFFLALIDVSLAEQVLQCFYERNLLSFMCLGQKRKEKKKTESEGKECVKDFQKEEKKKNTPTTKRAPYS